MHDFYIFFYSKAVYELVDQTCQSNCTYTKSYVEKDAIDDATAGMIIVLLLFVFPAKLNFWPFSKSMDSIYVM